MDPELVGLAASALILVSLLLTSVVRLRIVNAVGAAVFVVYGLMIDALPVWGMNAAIVVVDLYQLWQLLRERGDERVDAVEVAWDSPVLARVLHVHADDIRQYVAGATVPRPHPDTRAWLVLRDTTPASVLLAHAEDDRVVVDLDYATPATRDLRAGRLLHEELDVLHDVGDGPAVAHAGPREHRRYLAQVGFREAGDGTWRRPPGGGPDDG